MSGGDGEGCCAGDLGGLLLLLLLLPVSRVALMSTSGMDEAAVCVCVCVTVWLSVCLVGL
jgi:hypothetical protein